MVDRANHKDEYSSCTEGAYATIDRNSILARFPPFMRNAQKKENSNLSVTDWQCQAIATNYKRYEEWLSPVVVTSICANKLTSPLLATKPLVDKNLYRG